MLKLSFSYNSQESELLQAGLCFPQPRNTKRELLFNNTPMSLCLLRLFVFSIRHSSSTITIKAKVRAVSTSARGICLPLRLLYLQLQPLSPWYYSPCRHNYDLEGYLSKVYCLWSMADLS